MANPIGFSSKLPRLATRSKAGPAVAEPALSSGDQVSISRSACLTTLAGWGKRMAMRAVDGVAGLGLFLLAPRRSQQLQQSYEKGASLLGPDFSQRVADSAFKALVELVERADLPGANARERLDFILWYTDSNRGSHEGGWSQLKQIFTHFHPQSPFLTQANDRGFAQDVSDSRKWYNPDATGFVMDNYTGRVDQGSPQVGHFLTAVDIGRQTPLLEKALHSAALGHELIGDDQGPLRQVLVGLSHSKDRKLFEQVIAAAERGDREQARQLVATILPDLSDAGQEPGRVGNSRQDLLNTSYGMAMGRLVREGGLQTRRQLADWLQKNLGQN
jgi:hypothetical protein